MVEAKIRGPRTSSIEFVPLNYSSRLDERNTLHEPVVTGLDAKIKLNLQSIDFSLKLNPFENQRRKDKSKNIIVIIATLETFQNNRPSIIIVSNIDSFLP